MDINMKLGDCNFNCRAVAIIKDNNKILFQKRINDKYFALPGGKIKTFEKAEDAVKRELYEELGLCDFKILKMVDISEYFFEFGEEKFHQYIFSFLVDVSDKWIFEKEEFFGVEEDKLIYKWIDCDCFEGLIKPDYLKNSLNNINDFGISFISYKEL